MKNTNQEQTEQKKAQRKALIKKAVIGGLGLGVAAAGVYFVRKITREPIKVNVDLYPKTPMRELFNPDDDPAFTASKVTDAMGRVFEGHWFDPGDTSDEYIFFTTKEYTNK